MPVLNRVGVLCLVVFLGGSVAAADSIPKCKTQSLTDYIALGVKGCLIDDKDFSNFEYTKSGKQEPDADEITVTPLFTPGDPGLMFTAKPEWQSDTKPLANTFARLTYSVAVEPGGGAIFDNSLAVGGGLVTDGASYSVLEFCLPACGELSVTNRTPQSATDTLEPPLFDEDTSTVISTDTGPKGFSEVASVTERFSEVPEPSSILLSVIALLGICMKLAGLSWGGVTGRKSAKTSELKKYFAASYDYVSSLKPKKT